MKPTKNMALYKLADFNHAPKRKVIDDIDPQEKKCCISLKERIVFNKCYQLQSMGKMIQWHTTHKPVHFGNTYNDDVICKKDSKKLANDVFSQMIELYSESGDLLYLDANSMLTTNTLIKYDISGSKIPVNFNCDIINKMLRTNLDDVYPFFGTLCQAMEFHNCKKSLRGAWFDYCGTFDGNCKKQLFAKKDIRFLFQHSLMANQSVFAATFSLRDARLGKTWKQQRIRIQAFIKYTSFSRGYKVERLAKMIYFPAMLFLVYSCKSVK